MGRQTNRKRWVEWNVINSNTPQNAAAQQTKQAKDPTSNERANGPCVSNKARFSNYGSYLVEIERPHSTQLEVGGWRIANSAVDMDLFATQSFCHHTTVATYISHRFISKEE